MPGLRGTARRALASYKSPAGKKAAAMRLIQAALKARVAARRAGRAKQLVSHERARRATTFQNAGGIVTQSSANFSPSRRRLVASLYRKLAAPSFLLTNAPSSFNALCGFQATSWQALQNRSQLQEYLQALQFSPTPAGNNTRRFLIDYTKSIQYYTNSSSASCTLDIYDIMTKVDNDIASPVQAWADGMLMSTNPPSPLGANVINVLGALPTMSVKFNQFFKIKKVTHVNLAPGATHRHNVNIYQKQIINEQRILENVNYAGYTMFQLCIVRGVPVSDTAGAPPSELREVSSAPITIDRVTQISAKIRYVADLDTDIMVTNNMVTLVNPDTMNTFGSAASGVTVVN